MKKRTMAISVAALLLAIGGFLAWNLLTPPAAPPDAPSVVATVFAPAAAAPAGVTVGPAATVTAAPPKPAAAAEAPPSVYERLQNRLDAIATAYTAGDPRAAETAMWPNHAVVRPNGTTLDRSALLGQWMTEWESFKDRKLSFVIDEVFIEDDQVTAYWTMDLTARVLGEDNEMHDFAAHGTQKAIFQRERGVDQLEGPIRYHGYEQTWDGMLFKPE